MHAILGALALCRQVHLYGYSYYDEMLKTRPGHVNGPQEMYAGHSWHLDMAVIRLLHLAGRAAVCTADDPTVPWDVLRARGSPSPALNATLALDS